MWDIKFLNIFTTYPRIAKKIIKIAKKIVDKYTPKTILKLSFSSKKENEISFRLHRFIGALEFIRIYLGPLTNQSPQGKIIEDVLDGANTKFLLPTTFMRDVIKEISKISKENDWNEFTLVCLKLIGKVAYSKKKTPIFMDSLFKFVRLVVSKRSDRDVVAAAKTVLNEIDKIIITDLDKAEKEINKIVAEALEQINPKQKSYAKSILKALPIPFISN